MSFFKKKFSYSFVLDHRPGSFLSWFFSRLFKRVQFDENIIDDLKQMNRDGTVIYSIKYRGRLDYLLCHYSFRRSHIPYPKIAFDLNMHMVLPLSQLFRVMKFNAAYLFKHGRLPSAVKTGFFREAVREGVTSLLCLVDPKGFARHFFHSEKDYLSLLLETQKEMDRPVYIVPQVVLYRKTTEKEHTNLLGILFGYKDKSGFIRKIVLFFRNHRRTFIDFGRPLNLQTYLEGQPDTRSIEEMASEIRQILIESIDSQKRVVLGPIMKSRQQIKEKVLKNEEIIKTIEHMAGGKPERVKQLRKKAGGYFDEIAADYNIAYIQAFHIVLTWLWKKIFQGIDVDPAEFAVVREWARKGPVVYVPSHKSHIDYLVLNHFLYQHYMHTPRTAAGRNLSFWPMGHIFRKSGAFFIRRSFKGARLYSRVFTRYVKVLLEDGHPFEFFIEGGRSRSGKLIIPKVGFLSVLLQAYRDGSCNDLVFVPASITYDRIIEEKAYLKELGGATKKDENFSQVLKATRFLKTKFGKIYIRFGQPLSLKEYLERENAPADGTLRHLAFHLTRSINKVTLATPLSLVATAILTKHRKGFHLYELTETVKVLLRFLKEYEVPTATTLNYVEKTVEETLLLLINRKIVNALEEVDGSEIFYFVEEEKKRELEYYKNSIIHFFISHAFVAVSLLTGTDEVTTDQSILDDYTFLKDLFKNEFVYGDNKTQEEIDNVADYFLNASFVTRSDDNMGYKLTRLGFDMLPIWAALVKTFLESYWIVTRSSIQRESKAVKRGSLLKNMNYMGLRFHKLGIIDHREAISQVTFENAIPVINEKIRKKNGESEEDSCPAGEKLLRLSQRLHDLAHL